MRGVPTAHAPLQVPALDSLIAGGVRISGRPFRWKRALA
jgi:hypothetical protein